MSIIEEKEKKKTILQKPIGIRIIRIREKSVAFLMLIALLNSDFTENNNCN